MLGLNLHFHCSKREFVLFQKTYPLSWIHISMFKKRIKSTPNTRMLCFHPYFNAKQKYSLCSNYIYLFLIHISMFKEENSLITCVLIPISMPEKRIYSFRAAFVVALMKKRGKLPSIIWVQLNLSLYDRRRRRRRLPMVLKLHFPSINFQRGWSAFAKIQSLRKEDII